MQDGLLDTRTGVGRLAEFSGKEDDWRPWSFRATCWLALLPAPPDTDSVSDMLHTARSLDAPIPLSSLGPEARQVSRTIFYVLVQSLSGRAYRLAESVEIGNGFELWRRLHAEYEGQAGGKKIAMLLGLLNPSWTADMAKGMSPWNSCRTGRTRSPATRSSRVHQWRTT